MQFSRKSPTIPANSADYSPGYRRQIFIQFFCIFRLLMLENPLQYELSKRRRQAPPQRNQTMAIIEKIAFIGNATCIGALVAFGAASFAVLIANAFGL